MTDKLILTYSLLGYIKETAGESTKSLTEIFVPIAKKALSDYSQEHNLTEIKGRSLVEIQNKIKEIFELEIPIPILQVILKTIEKDVNDAQTFKLYGDGAFIIKSFNFNGIEKQIKQEKQNIEILENDYKRFCENTKTEFDFSKLKDFILAQKIDLFSEKKSSYLDLSYAIPKYINQKFEDEKIFSIITNIYLGGIISSYLTLKIDKKVTDTELLIDTNFFISLIDLNTEDAYHTCKQLFELCKRMGFRFTILNTTVEEIRVLLNNRIADFASKDIIGSVRCADIFNACVRREIDKTQLEKIKDSVLQKLTELDIIVLQDAQIRDIKEKAERSQSYRDLKQKRDYELSALNDAIAHLYVQKKRGSHIKEFADVKCWFLHNSFNSHFYAQNQQIFERYSLGANELLVLLWLANPSQMATTYDHILAQSTLSSYVTKYRIAKMPSRDILKVIKKRADKAIELGQITEQDLYKTCIRMSEGQLTNDDFSNIETITDNKFAEKIKQFSTYDELQRKALMSQNKEKELTISQLSKKNKQLSEKQKKDNATINQLQQDTNKQQQEIDELKKSMSELKQLQNKQEREEYVLHKLRKDKKEKIYYCTFIVVVLLLWVVNNYLYEFISVPKWLSAMIGLVLYAIPLIVMRFIDHSHIKNIFCPTNAKIKYQKEFDNQIKE